MDRNLGPGEYFGEMALLLNEPRHANCVAKGGRVVCYTLDKEKFSSLLGSLKEVRHLGMFLHYFPPIYADIARLIAMTRNKHLDTYTKREE